MTAEELKAIPPGDPVPEYHGIRPGQQVIVHGWRGPGTEDLRKVKRMERTVGHSQSGVMVFLDRPLNNGSYKVDAGWLFKTGDPRRSGK